MKVLITGTAGFIGYHLAVKMLSEGYEVTGIDSINDYYDVNLKYARLKETGIERKDIVSGKKAQSSKYPGYSFYRVWLEDKESIDRIFKTEKPERVVNLAAQAGVRYSLVNPHAYINSNISGFANILEACRHHKIDHLVYASSSSVYGLNEKMPFSTSDNVDHPVSLYAATKKSNELMAHSYSYLFGLPATGLRFFTVYGPWGRPDMALFIFTKAILEGRPIQINNNGEMERDFTYIDDIVNAMARVIEKPAEPDPEWTGMAPDPASSPAPYRLYNIGNNSPVRLMDFIKAIEDELGITAKKEFLPMQPGDVKATWADVNALIKWISYRPGTGVKEGIARFIKWYLRWSES